MSVMLQMDGDRGADTHAGSIETTVLPLDAATNSLLMKSPVGWVNLRPLGASSSTDSDMLTPAHVGDEVLTMATKYNE